MPTLAARALLTAACLFAFNSVAGAQSNQGPASQDQPSYPVPIELRTPPTAAHRPLGDSDLAQLRSGLAAAKRGDVAAARSAMQSISDPVGRKVVLWNLVDTSSTSLSFFELDQARRDLAAWPRQSRRNSAAEKALETSGQSPQQIVAWFGGGEPQTAEGAMALAAALEATGQGAQAQALIKRWWREKIFESEPQGRMLARFGRFLTQDDHVQRADIILYGAQGPAAREVVALLPADHRQLAEARMALRENRAGAPDLALGVPAHLRSNPGLAFERMAYYRRRGLETLALGVLRETPTAAPVPEAAERIWDERYRLTLWALQAKDAQAAYTASANTGLTEGADAAEAEFYAGWVALTKLRNAAQADKHFAAIERIGSSPITRGRALYWRGRAHEAMGDQAASRAYYQAAAEHNTTFYGQLAGEKIGQPLVLGSDPPITAADRARFESREPVRAAKLLIQAGERDLFRVFVLALDDMLPTAAEQAQLVDLARGHGEQMTSMMVVRVAAQRGFTLPDRGYPYRSLPQVYGGAEEALALGIIRQESSFDPSVRSHAGARGMMQLMPATAQAVARQLGVGYSAERLYEADYNMRLGSRYLGDVVGQFSGSYVMGIASYNAGPGRPAQWSAFCGDPRGAGTDPIDFIECIPFSETRNYVMRVMEGMQVYRAKLAGGTAAITLSRDLARGGYSYSGAPTVSAAEN